METKTRPKLSKSAVKRLLTALPPLLAIVLFRVFSRSRKLANFAVRTFSRPAKDALGTVFGLLPFSVMELMYIAAGLFVIYWLVSSVIRTVKAEKKLQTAAKRLFVLLMVILYLLGAYLWLLGVDYHADTFREKSGLDAAPVSTEDLYAVTAWFVRNAAALSGTVSRDAEGHYSEDLDAVFTRSAGIYDALSEEFPCLEARFRMPKKMLLFSKVSSCMGFTGVFFPFTGESNINIDAPGCMIPFTVAHELAHQRSTFDESEANFLGIAACLSSGDPVYTYSGYLSGSLYLLNALYRADRDAWRELHSLITGPMAVDWNDNNAYWDRFESKVSTVSDKVYDGFLKAQGQELGTRSYGACVDLLVAYYLPQLPSGTEAVS